MKTIIDWDNEDWTVEDFIDEIYEQDQLFPVDIVNSIEERERQKCGVTNE